MDAPRRHRSMPAAVRELARLLLDQIENLSEKITGLDTELRRRASTDNTARRLTTIPGIGPITAAAITTFAPPMETFSKGRDFAAWVGLTPRQHSSGGKERLGRTSKMGQRDIRRLSIIGAVAVVRWAARKGAPEGSWLAQMLERNPKMLVAVALAKCFARETFGQEPMGLCTASRVQVTTTIKRQAGLGKVCGDLMRKAC